MTPVAPRIVNDVSYVMMTKYVSLSVVRSCTGYCLVRRKSRMSLRTDL